MSERLESIEPSRKGGDVRHALAALMLMAALAGCGGDAPQDTATAAKADATTDKLAEIHARGTLVGYHEADYPPQSIDVKGAQRPADTKCTPVQLTAGEVTGFDNETTKLVAERLGVEACFATPSWTEVTSGNWGDRMDIAYGSGSINADRMERLYMTQPYYAVPNYYFVAAGSKARHAADLDGGRIGACASCSHELYLKGQLEIPGIDIHVDVADPEVVTYETEAPGLAAAAKGKIDAFLAAEPVGRAQIKRGVALRRLQEIAFTYYPSGFVDKSSGLDSRAFVAKVDEIIRAAQQDGTMARLSRKFFGRDYIPPAAAYDVGAIDQQVR
jgi:ABC-type amino acid transport substrate-binding protein